MSSTVSSRPASHLRVSGLSHTFGGFRVLTDISFTVSHGELVGLIGENGSGKSTLLRTLAGLITPDGGQIQLTVPGVDSPRVGLLHQEPPFSSAQTVGEAMESAIAPSRRAAAAVDETADRLARNPEDPALSTEYASALERAEQLGAWTVDARVSQMLTGIGLGHLPRDRPTGELSGGQRARLSLVWVLLSAPDLLLLDEPTNHLDDDATAYLRGVLASWNGPVLIASHDRAFLDEAVTTLVDLDPSPVPHEVSVDLIQDGAGTGIGVTRFSGTYTEYLNARLDARQRWERQYRDEQAELKRLRASVRENQTVGHEDWKPRSEIRMAQKFYADRNAKVVSRRVNDVRTRLAELEKQQVRRPPQPLIFRGLPAGAEYPKSVSDGHSILTASEATVQDRLPVTSLSLAPREKLLITGPNGCGKSTLLAVLSGDLAPTSGTVTWQKSARVRTLRQEVHLPDPHDRGGDRTVEQTYVDLAQRAEAVPLSTFGLVHPRDFERPLRLLSTGQQRRLELAVLLADPPEVLLLDEPTNHFSLELATRLEAAVPDYPGAVVVASHDRWLRRTWQGQTLALGRD